MKNHRTLITLLLAMAIFAACKKDNHPVIKPPDEPGSGIDTVVPPPKPAPVYLARIQQGIDADLSKDTVYRLTWKDDKRISILVDSIRNDTLAAAYDNAGNLTTITDKGASPDNATFTYDGDNHLTQITYTNATTTQQYVFEYTNGVVSKKSYYTATGAAALKLNGYFTYSIVDSNITGITAFTSTNFQIGTATLTYGTQPNPFKNLCLFNYRKRLNMDDIAPFEAYFNRNIVTSLTTFGLTATLNNTFDSKQQLGRIVADDKINLKLYTWQFFYF
jgi:YD repeat-containing protein